MVITPNSFCQVKITMLPKPNKDLAYKEKYKSVSLMNIDEKL